MGWTVLYGEQPMSGIMYNDDHGDDDNNNQTYYT